MYLTPDDYTTYGLPPETSTAWITAASAMIDAHCRRTTLAQQSYTERQRLGPSQTARLSYGPLVSVESIKARPARRCREPWENPQSFAQIYAETFAAPLQWFTLDPTTLDVSAALGTVVFTPNIMGTIYSEAEITYTAGFAEIPEAIKVATAQLIKNAQSTPALNVKSNKVDTLELQYFSASLFDEQTTALLAPYVAERLAA